jgi:hypothetical protein
MPSYRETRVAKMAQELVANLNRNALADRGQPMTSDLIAQVRMNLESVEAAARACREMSGTDAQAIHDRVVAMIQLLETTRDSLVRAGHARL